MILKYLPILFATTLCLSGCQESFDSEQARAEILALHQIAIEAHLAKDAAPLVDRITDDYLAVSSGNVQRIEAAKMQGMLQNYLDSTKFSHYVDTAEPIIEFSKGGTLAWAIFQVRVAGDSFRESGASTPFDTQWAWLTLFEKRDGEWARIADVSTNKPY